MDGENKNSLIKRGCLVIHSQTIIHRKKSNIFQDKHIRKLRIGRKMHINETFLSFLFLYLSLISIFRRAQDFFFYCLKCFLFNIYIYILLLYLFSFILFFRAFLFFFFEIFLFFVDNDDNDWFGNSLLFFLTILLNSSLFGVWPHKLFF